jgi:hypothetical protein
VHGTARQFEPLGERTDAPFVPLGEAAEQLQSPRYGTVIVRHVFLFPNSPAATAR